MTYQSGAALEAQFVEQLNNQSYSSVSTPDYDALLENFKVSKNISFYSGLFVYEKML